MKNDDLKTSIEQELDTEEYAMHDVDMEDEDVEIESLEDGTLAEKLKKLRVKLGECESKKLEYMTSLQRAQADFVNLRKRDDEERINLIKNANEDLILELLPVLDSFSMAMSDKAWESVSENWRKGVEYIKSQLMSVLSNHNVKEVSPLGEDYDPLLHEAIGSIESDKKDWDKVLEVAQKGYTINNRLLRPAKVRVGVEPREEKSDK